MAAIPGTVEGMSFVIADSDKASSMHQGQLDKQTLTKMSLSGYTFVVAPWTVVTQMTRAQRFDGLLWVLLVSNTILNRTNRTI